MLNHATGQAMITDNATHFINSLESRMKTVLSDAPSDLRIPISFVLLDAMKNDREPEVTGWDGFVAQAICDAIYESSYCGQAVKVDDVISGEIEDYQEDINKHWGL